MRKLIMVILLASCLSQSRGQYILPLKEQSRVVDEILAERLNNLLPVLMKETGIDMWVVISREYNEDPVIKTMLPPTWFAARRRTVLIFYRSASGAFEKLAVSRYNVGSEIKASWDMTKFPDQWDAVVDLIEKRNPAKIGLNYSADFGHADGLTYTEQKELTAKLSAATAKKIVSAEPLAVRWLETRTEKEMQLYPQLIQITHDIIKEGFSEKVIMPGVTTTNDLVWWFRQKIRDLGLDTWFHPSVSVQRNDPENFDHLRTFSTRPNDEVIRTGDLLHVDIGITYLRLNTDIQQHAYVLQPGEKTAPASLVKAFENANRVQDILTAQFKTGKTGNQILKDALAQAKAENIQAVIYTHPIGYHGHAAGTTIGMWDNQVNVVGTGDYALRDRTAYSIELNASTLVPEWKKDVRMMLEQDGFWDGKQFRYISGRQVKLLLVPSHPSHIGD